MQNHFVFLPSTGGEKKTDEAFSGTYFDAFCDLWAPIDDIPYPPVDVGYGARLRDAQRIRGYFDKAIATVAGLESRKG